MVTLVPRYGFDDGAAEDPDDDILRACKKLFD
jgi:hypothetical protein